MLTCHICFKRITSWIQLSHSRTLRYINKLYHRPDNSCSWYLLKHLSNSSINTSCVFFHVLLPVHFVAYTSVLKLYFECMSFSCNWVFLSCGTSTFTKVETQVPISSSTAYKVLCFINTVLLIVHSVAVRTISNILSATLWYWYFC